MAHEDSKSRLARLKDGMRYERGVKESIGFPSLVRSTQALHFWVKVLPVRVEQTLFPIIRTTGHSMSLTWIQTRRNFTTNHGLSSLATGM